MAFSPLKCDSGRLSGNQSALKSPDPLPFGFNEESQGLQASLPIQGLRLPTFHKRDIEQILFLFSWAKLSV